MIDRAQSDDLVLLREYRRRQKLRTSNAETDPATFISRTMIQSPQGGGISDVPFQLWPAQQDVLSSMRFERLLVILKARQLGMTWLACGFALWLCTQFPGQQVLVFSQGQLEANGIVDRVRYMYQQHLDRDTLPEITADNTQRIQWSNGSKIQSLPATRKAGRSFSASLVIFDEFAFMLFGSDLFGAAKPTIDDGGMMWLISSADGQGTPYHQFWQRAEANLNGFKPIFLDWKARPSRGPDWRDRRITESFGDVVKVLREYPESPQEAFSAAAGQIYQGVWSDAPDGSGNVTEDAEYIADNSGNTTLYWATDDGYSGKIDPATGYYTAESHPRAILFVQQRPNGDLCIVDESYACQKLSDEHIKEALERSYKRPAYVAHGPGFAEWRGRIIHANLQPMQVTSNVEEGIKELRRWLAPDTNGHRRILVHPRCKHLRFEMVSYRRDATGAIIKSFDHGCDALRYLCWTLRHTI